MPPRYDPQMLARGLRSHGGRNRAGETSQNMLELEGVARTWVSQGVTESAERGPFKEIHDFPLSCLYSNPVPHRMSRLDNEI